MFALSSLSLAAHALRSLPRIKRGRIWHLWVSELKVHVSKNGRLYRREQVGNFPPTALLFFSNSPASICQTRRHKCLPLLTHVDDKLTLLGTVQENSPQHAVTQTLQREYPGLNPYPLNHQPVTAHVNLKLSAVFLNLCSQSIVLKG